MPRHRLKRYNAGATLRLLETDLVIADWLPPSLGIHLIRGIATLEGVCERADYSISPQSAQQFRHSLVSLAPSTLSALRLHLRSLGDAEAAIALDARRPDREDYEPPNRRFLRYWHVGLRARSAPPHQNYFDDHGFPRQLVKTYMTAFDSVWDLLFTVTTDAVGPT